MAHSQTHPFLSPPAVHSFADIKSEDDLNQLFPEAIFPECPEGADTLEGSMEQLKKGLESGTVLIQFEVGGPRAHPRPGPRCLGGLLRCCRASQDPGGPGSSPNTEGTSSPRPSDGLRAQKAGDAALSPSLNSASPSYSSMCGSHGETRQKSRRRDSELFSCQHKGSKHSAVEGSGEAEWVAPKAWQRSPSPAPPGILWSR